MRPVDPDLLKAFQLKVWMYKQGELVSLMVHLGDELGLYAAMPEGEATTSAELAEATGLDERWVREWLLGQAAAGLVVKEGDDYSLDPEAIEVLVNEDSLAYAGGAFDPPTTPEALSRIKESFRTGRGLTYGAMGDEMAEAVDAQGAPWLRDYLIDEVIGAVDGLTGRLESGARVADIGCGGAVSTEALAKRFPNSTFVGVEPSEAAGRLAERRLGPLPNATLATHGGEDLEPDHSFDLILTFDCMHDVPFPDRIAAAVRGALREDGVWLVKDMRATSDWDRATRNPTLALQYGYSVVGCLASATSEEGGAGLGTMGFTPEVAESIANVAGFGSVNQLPIKTDPVHAYYEVRP